MAQVLRVPKLDLPTILAAQNPQIDLRLEAYEASTRNFLKAISNYTQRALTEITNRKNAHVVEKKRVQEKIQQIESETNQCKVKEIELIAVLDKEQEEKKEAESSVAAFRRQLASIKEKCASVDVEIEQHRIITANLSREREREQSILGAHASRTVPELAHCEHVLQCAVEGIDKDKLLIQFSHIDPTDLNREFSLVIDVSSRSYKVPTTTPFLPTLPILLDELNENRDVYAFIKHVRQAFSSNQPTHLTFVALSFQNMKYSWASLLSILSVVAGINATQKIILANDDGWATSTIRALYDSFNAANFNVILSAPASDQSGTGSTSAIPTNRKTPCEFNSCPANSGPEGFNATDPRLNWVNSYPVDAVRWATETLAPQFWGMHLRSSLLVALTSEAIWDIRPAPEVYLQAARADAKASPPLTSQPTSPRGPQHHAPPQHLRVPALPLLPPGVTLNVNYPAVTGGCTAVSDFKWVLTRLQVTNAVDVETCGSNKLPKDQAVVEADGCYISVSVVNATTKMDVDAATQGAVYDRLSGMWSCIP
ncbi:putative kinetochore protein SPC25 [Grifola frondosa]|uniref:Putative kinetochore protein SPC25 n=1 Tax=Grifola frondosa TaxID=5627 RepID=A0A1C7MCH2_GRIFR|nr:putative kinetochore protein SPC25 [Grifola frondosa]